jgi:hypothetical protein
MFDSSDKCSLGHMLDSDNKCSLGRACGRAILSLERPDIVGVVRKGGER